MTPIAGAPRAPYALEPTAFPLPALAAQAGRAPLGGPREIVLAVFLVARLVVDAATPRNVLSLEQRRARARDTIHWLTAAALSAPLRAALTRLAEAASDEDSARMAAAFDTVMGITASHLDPAARLELGRLAQVVAK